MVFYIYSVPGLMDKSSDNFLEQVLFDQIADFLRFRFGVEAMNRDDVKIRSQEETRPRQHLQNDDHFQSRKVLERSLFPNKMIRLKVSILVSAKAYISPREAFINSIKLQLLEIRKIHMEESSGTSV